MKDIEIRYEQALADLSGIKSLVEEADKLIYRLKSFEDAIAEVDSQDSNARVYDELSITTDNQLIYFNQAHLKELAIVIKVRTSNAYKEYLDTYKEQFTTLIEEHLLSLYNKP
jgi:hypothetical protein